MALWAGQFQDMDPLTLAAIVQMQLEDSQELATMAKGKQREGVVTDAELALQLYTEELQACDATLADRNLAQSIALAVLRDGNLIHREYEREQQLARDREFAERLAASDNETERSGPSLKRRHSNEADPWEDDEMLAKAAAIYMHPLNEAQIPLCDVVEDNSDAITVAESSTWAAARSKDNKPLMGHCVACQDEKEFFEFARVPCNHEYCRPCLARLFEMAMTDESLYPPRCDGQAIPLSQVRFFLPQDLARAFVEKEPELMAKDRTYCYYGKCSAFIPVDSVVEDIGTCPRCGRTTCTMCKAQSHSGDCPEDMAVQQLIETAETQQWQRCHSCKRFVELQHGCNHITFDANPLEIKVQSLTGCSDVDVELISATYAGLSGRRANVISGTKHACLTVLHKS